MLQFDELVTESTRAIATGQAPDIISFDNPDFALFSSRGVMLDITDRVTASSVIKTDSYYAGPLNSVTWDGRLYGLPKYTDTIGLFYNKDMFRAKGLDPDEPPSTWDELLDAARKLNDPAAGVYGITFSARGNEEGTFQFLPWIQMSGGDYTKVNGPGAVKALELWKVFLDEKLASQDVLSVGQWDSTGFFNNGQAAMAISGPWELNRMSEDAKFDWGVALLPTETEGGQRASALGGAALSTPSGAASSTARDSTLCSSLSGSASWSPSRGLPLVYNVLMSFQQVDMFTLGVLFRPWVGFDNYIAVVNQPEFWLVVRNTLVFVVASIGVQFTLGLALAVLFMQRFPGSATIRGLFLVSWVMPGLAVGAIWSWILAAAMAEIRSSS